MAKRKKRKSGSRRRVGAAKLNANNPIVKIGAVAAGYFLGDKINEPLQKMIGDKLDGKIVGAAEAGVGALLMFKAGKKTMVKTVAGGILLGAGAKKVMAEFGIGGIGPYGSVPVVSGAYGRVPVIGARRMAGYIPHQSLNGYSPNASLNGRNKIMSGFPGSGSGMTQSCGSDMMN